MFIANIFAEHTNGFKVGPNGLRSSYVTWFYGGGLGDLSEAMKEQMALAMRHSQRYVSLYT